MGLPCKLKDCRPAAETTAPAGTAFRRPGPARVRAPRSQAGAVADRPDARLGATLVKMAARRAGHADRSDRAALRLDHQAATQHGDVGQAPYGRGRLSRL